MKDFYKYGTYMLAVVAGIFAICYDHAGVGLVCIIFGVLGADDIL